MHPPDEPDYLLCPITRLVFQDPVVVASGKTYERWAILKHWQHRGRPHDPLSNLWLSHGGLKVDEAMRVKVKAFLDAHVDYVPIGWDGREVPRPCHRSQWVARSWNVWNHYKWLCCSILLAVCAVLSPLSAHVAGDARKLVALLRDYPNSAWVQANAIAALANMAFAGAPQRAEVVRAAAIVEAIAAMRLHSRSEHLQASACALLANLAFENASNAHAIARAGGIDSALRAAALHSSSAAALRSVCAALQQLSLGGPELRRALGDAGAVPAAASALRGHPADAPLQMSCCAALECLAIDDHANKLSLRAHGGVGAIVAALERYPAQPEIQGHGASALANLASGEEHVCADVVRAGGVGALSGVLGRHPGNSWVAGHACRGLAGLAAHSAEGRLALVDYPGKLCTGGPVQRQPVAVAQGVGAELLGEAPATLESAGSTATTLTTQHYGNGPEGILGRRSDKWNLP